MLMKNLKGRIVDITPEWVEYRLKEGFSFPDKKEIKDQTPEKVGKFIEGLPYI
jgi:hypothetical protein